MSKYCGHRDHISQGILLQPQPSTLKGAGLLLGESGYQEFIVGARLSIGLSRGLCRPLLDLAFLHLGVVDLSFG